MTPTMSSKDKVMREMSVRQMTWHHLPDLAYHNDDPYELPRDGPLLVDEEKAVECGLLTKLGKSGIVFDSARHLGGLVA